MNEINWIVKQQKKVGRWTESLQSQMYQKTTLSWN